VGGIPNSSQDIKQAHAAAVETYIESYVGLINENCGDMYFQNTLEDWSTFDINNRTKHDATISSGLAIMACNKNQYRPTALRQLSKVNLGITTYDNSGDISKINI